MEEYTSPSVNLVTIADDDDIVSVSGDQESFVPDFGAGGDGDFFG